MKRVLAMALSLMALTAFVGADIAEAKRHVEALEFLFECEYRKRALPAR